MPAPTTHRCGSHFSCNLITWRFPRTVGAARRGSELAAEIASDKAKLEELAEMWAANQISGPEYLAARTLIVDRLERSDLFPNSQRLHLRC